MRRAAALSLALASACASRGTSAEAGSDAGESSASSGASTSSEGGSTESSSSSGTESTEGEPDPSDLEWEEFVAEREAWLRALVEPIADCVVQEDTEHPAFHGCIDWHSAVHATWALQTVSRLTGDPEWADLADETLDPPSVAAELAAIQAGAIPDEIPYGYAWFLLLAVERGRGGDADLVPLADEIEAQLRTWLASRSPAQIQAGVLADDYQNLSWTALNLWRWAQWTDDAELAAEMATFVEDRIMTAELDQACPLWQEATDIDDFFPPCLHRLMVIVTVLPYDVHRPWLEQYLYAQWDLAPLTEIDSAHQGGLNFSRAWGLWAAWVASDNPTYRDLYVDHVRTHVLQPQYWAQDYWSYSHWVAQFGVHAIELGWE